MTPNIATLAFASHYHDSKSLPPYDKFQFLPALAFERGFLVFEVTTNQPINQRSDTLVASKLVQDRLFFFRAAFSCRGGAIYSRFSAQVSKTPHLVVAVLLYWSTSMDSSLPFLYHEDRPPCLSHP